MCVGESRRRLRRAMATRRYQGVAIGHVHMKLLARDARRPLASALSAIAIALPRCEIASWKAERRSAWSPALPHHSIARIVEAGLGEVMCDRFGFGLRGSSGRAEFLPRGGGAPVGGS